MKTSNPVLSNLGHRPGEQPGYGHGQYPAGAGAYPAAPPAVRPMTIDDVVVKTVTLLAVVGLTAVIAWNVVPDRLLWPVQIIAAITGLVLGLIISFKQVTSPALIIAYAAIEGVFVGIVSKIYEVIAGFEGIILQAVVATFGVFFLMAILYKARIIRATPRFIRFMVAALAGVLMVIVINFVLSLFEVNTGLRDNGPLGIIFSLVCIVLASLSFVLSFHEVEEGIRMGLPNRYSWYASFGIVVSLVWLYLEVLRLLSFLQGDD